MRFWEVKSLAELDHNEWEALCDGCGKCCLHKLEDEDSGEIVYTSVACELLDISSCRCQNYQQRTRLVPECIDLTQHDFTKFSWMPKTCAYRLLANGQTLPEWHPLITGNTDSVLAAGVSVSQFAIRLELVDDLEDYVIDSLC